MPINQIEEVEEIISKPPSWITRWGITVIVGVFVIIFSLAWLIQYPDTIRGNAVVTTEIPPIKIVSPSSGKITKIYVKEGDHVTKGQTLLEIENPTDSNAILYLNRLVEEFSSFSITPEIYLNHVVDSFIPVGEMQESFDKFAINFSQYKELHKTAYYSQQQITLSNQLLNYQKLYKLSLSQNSIMDNEVRNLENKYTIDKGLFDKGAIAKFDLIQSENNYLTKLKDAEALKKNLIEYEMRINETRKLLFDSKFENGSQERKLISEIQNALHEIENYLYTWKQTYQLIASADGNVTFLKNITLGQYIEKSDEIIALLTGKNIWMCKVYLPSSGLGKIKSGQDVRINLNTYPSNEFGLLTGKVQSISTLPMDSLYVVTVSLPEQLLTTNNIVVVGTPEMTGYAEITTKKMSILERMIYRFKGILK